MFGAPPGDLRLHSEVPKQTAVLVVVVAAVAEYHVRAAPGPAALALHRWHCLKCRDQQGDVVAIAVGQSGRVRRGRGMAALCMPTIGVCVTLHQRCWNDQDNTSG